MAKRKRIQEVVVTDHALTRYRERIAPEATRESVREAVEEGLARGCMADRKPREFALYRERRVNLHLTEEVCVWTPDKRAAWLGRRTGPKLILRTTIAPTRCPA